VSCPAVGLCAAVDGAGHLLWRSSIAVGAWRRVAGLDPPQRMTAISCVRVTLCFGAGSLGSLYFGSPPRRSRWVAETLEPITGIRALACPSRSLCVGVDDEGRVLASRAPRNPFAWSPPMTIDGSGTVTSVSCASASLCVAISDRSGLLLSHDPASPWSWHPVGYTVADALDAVSCDRSALCVAVAGDGRVYATIDAARTPTTWTVTQVDGGAALTGASCTDVGLCVLVDAHGRVYESDAPASAQPAWSMATADTAHAALTAVSCLAVGLCTAADAGGDTLYAALPRPTVETGSASSSATTASLSAAVDPNDATLLDCRFEYGSTTAYGAQAPCWPPPRAAAGRQSTSGRLDGLEPATTYHFRVIASSLVGTAIGGDHVLTTAALAQASPWLTGTPAVGRPLTCHPGITVSAPKWLAYGWWRDSTEIAGAVAPTYVVTAADQTRHLSCTVAVGGDGGVTTTRSGGFKAIPPQETITESYVGADNTRGTSVTAPVTCSPQAAKRCVVALQLSSRSSSGAAVAVGSATATVPTGSTRMLAVSLDASGRRMLAQRHSLVVRLTVTGTILGVLTAPLQTRTLTLREGANGVPGAIVASSSGNQRAGGAG
jgi:hypothetical protein